MRRLLAFLRGLFPALKSRGTWADAVRVTDPARLARLERIYAEQVAWCGARGFVIQSPDCRVTLRVWPDELRAPPEFGVGKVLAPNVIAGDTGGTLLLRDGKLKDEAWLIAHECRHAITGIGGHPKELFP
jgi:hypothetical protein